eukprot:g34797.t1
MDHIPLLGQLKEDRAMPPITSGRIQWWPLILSPYNYKLKHRPGGQVANADAFSCLSLVDTPPVVPPRDEPFLVLNFLDMLLEWKRRLPDWRPVQEATSRPEVVREVCLSPEVSAAGMAQSRAGVGGRSQTGGWRGRQVPDWRPVRQARPEPEASAEVEVISLNVFKAKIDRFLNSKGIEGYGERR